MIPTIPAPMLRGHLRRGTGFPTEVGGKGRGVPGCCPAPGTLLEASMGELRLPSTVGCREVERQLPGPMAWMELHGNGGAAHPQQAPGMVFGVGGPWSHPCRSLRILPGQVPQLQWSSDCSLRNSPFQAPRPISALADHHTASPSAHLLPEPQEELLEQMPPPALPAPSLTSRPQAGLELITSSLGSTFPRIRPAVLKGQEISSALPILTPQSHSWPRSSSTPWPNSAPAGLPQHQLLPAAHQHGPAMDIREVTKRHGASAEPGGMGSTGPQLGCGSRVCLCCRKNSHIRANLPVK